MNALRHLLAPVCGPSQAGVSFATAALTQQREALANVPTEAGVGVDLQRGSRMLIDELSLSFKMSA